MVSVRLVIAVLLLSTVAAACGSDDDTSADFERYAQAVEEMREQYVQSIDGLRAIGPNSSLSDAGDYFEQISGAQREGISALEQLEPPESASTAHAALIQALTDLFDFNIMARDRVATMTDQSELAEMAADPDLSIARNNELLGAVADACAELKESNSDEAIVITCELPRG